MADNAKRFLQGLPICAVFALAAAVSTLLFHATSDYRTFYSAVKVYSIGWFAACVLSFYCGLLVVPRSLGIMFSFAGLVAFTILCAVDPAVLSQYPVIGRLVQMLPAVLFIAAWAGISISACRSEKKKIRISSWFWVTIFAVLLSSFAVFQFTQMNLLKQRNNHIMDAREKTRLLAERLDAYKAAHGTYPDTLADAGLDTDAAALPYRNQRIKYFGHGTDFVLTFDDPMLSHQSAFSYDTTKDGWFPGDPEEALIDFPQHMFLGILRKR